jgi:hypothetical protein
MGETTMAKIRVSKMDVVRRQLDTAIRMTFGEEDAVAIHSVAAAANQILRDICNDRGDVESYCQVKCLVRPECEATFWTDLFNRSANFFKHADRDANGIHEMDDEDADFIILFALHWYEGLGFFLTPEMRVFANWLTMCRPELLKADAEATMEATIQVVGVPLSQFRMARNTLRQSSRHAKLKTGQFMLKQAKLCIGSPSL